jgi:transposase
MKKDSKKEQWQQEEGLVIGVDLGDKDSRVCALGADKEIRQEDRVSTTTPRLQQWFGSLKPSLVVMEAGSHSPWVSRLVEGWGTRWWWWTRVG